MERIAPPEGVFIPHDIVIQILLFVPARFLSKFRCVCKSWLSFITDPRFIAAHTKQALTSDPMTPPLIVFASESTRDLKLNFYDYKSGMDKTLLLQECIGDGDDDLTIHSVDGLLLLCSNDLINVFNPFTREIVKLPPPPPRSNSHSLGLGVSRSTCKYNVVCLEFNQRICQGFHVFTQGSDCWRKSARLPSSMIVISKNCASVRGVLYWRTWRRNLGFNPKQPYGPILSFDIDDEKFALVPPPPIPYSSSFFSDVEVLQQNLCIVNHRDNMVDIWILKDRENYEWSKRYSFRGTPLLVGDTSFLVMARAIEVEEGKLLLALEEKLVLYDTINGRLLKLRKMSRNRREMMALTPYLQDAPYTETLAALG